MSDMSDLSDSNGARARYSMAGGKTSDSFGVAPLPGGTGKSMGPATGKILADGDWPERPDYYNAHPRPGYELPQVP